MNCKRKKCIQQRLQALSAHYFFSCPVCQLLSPHCWFTWSCSKNWVVWGIKKHIKTRTRLFVCLSSYDICIFARNIIKHIVNFIIIMAPVMSRWPWLLPFCYHSRISSSLSQSKWLKDGQKAYLLTRFYILIVDPLASFGLNGWSMLLIGYVTVGQLVDI